MQKYLLSYLLCSLFIWILPQTSQGSNQVISTVKLLCDFFSRHLIYDSGQVFQCCLVLHQTAVRNHTWNRDRAASKDWQSCKGSKQAGAEGNQQWACLLLRCSSNGFWILKKEWILSFFIYFKSLWPADLNLCDLQAWLTCCCPSQQEFWWLLNEKPVMGNLGSATKKPKLFLSWLSKADLEGYIPWDLDICFPVGKSKIGLLQNVNELEWAKECKHQMSMV